MFHRDKTGAYLFRWLGGWIVAVAIMSGISGCEDEATQIGLEFKEVLSQVQPVYTDTFSIFSSTETIDSLPTHNATVAIVGDYVDPVFGRMKSSFVSQFRLESPWEPGFNAEVDSMKIFLESGGYYGNGLIKQTLNVYELLMDIYNDSVYYSTFDPTDSISEWPIGSTTFLPTDSIVEITLSKSFARRIIRDTANLHFQSDFIKAFKGLYFNVDPLPGEGAVVRFNILSTSSYLVIYYHNDTHESLQFNFYINVYAARINMFSHDYSEAPAETAIRYLNTGIEDSVIYAQGMAGVITKLDIPGLKNLRDSTNIIVNSAQLTFPLSPDDPMGAASEHPDQIDLNVIDEGVYYNLSDQSFSNDYYGGTFDDETNSYTLNITRHIQGYLKGSHDYTTLYLTLPNQNTNPGRVVLNGRNHSNPLTLKIVYTRN